MKDKKLIDLLWDKSDERRNALQDFLDRTRIGRGPMSEVNFPNSPEFRNARLAFRRRMNNSPEAETT